MPASYDYYRIFYFVAKYRSFTGAAAALQSNQPNVTRAMNNLERELGCRLFLRSNRGVSLTPEGERLYTHVQIAQEQLQAGEKELSSGKSLHSGLVSISAREAALHGPLLPVLRRFHLTYPGVRIRISSHSTPQAIAALKAGQVELAVVTTPTGVTQPLRESPLVSFQDILIAGPHFSTLAQKPFHIKQLADHPLICLGRDTKTFEFFNALFVRHGAVLQPDVEVATTNQVLPMVEHDLGLGFVPPWFATEAIAQGRVFSIPLLDPIPRRSVCLVVDRRRPLSIAAQTLEQYIREAATAK